jgi:hypothetical protein
MSWACLAANASFKWGNIVNANSPTHPATTGFSAVTNCLTKRNSLGYWVLKWSNDFDVLA